MHRYSDGMIMSICTLCGFGIRFCSLFFYNSIGGDLNPGSLLWRTPRVANQFELQGSWWYDDFALKFV